MDEATKMKERFKRIMHKHFSSEESAVPNEQTPVEDEHEAQAHADEGHEPAQEEHEKADPKRERLKKILHHLKGS